MSTLRSRRSVWPRLYQQRHTATLARGYFLTHDIANQGNLDSQLEYRFNTGILQHTALFGLDLKHYRIDDWQGFGGAALDSTC